MLRLGQGSLRRLAGRGHDEGPDGHRPLLGAQPWPARGLCMPGRSERGPSGWAPAAVLAAGTRGRAASETHRLKRRLSRGPVAPNGRLSGGLAGRTSCGLRHQGRPGLAMERATESIIRRLQANFKDATSEAARQIIGEEVERFLTAGSGAEEQEIAALEEAIRNRLAGRRGTSGKAERLAAKKAAFSQDEWARISQYVAFMAKEDEARRAAQERAAKKAAASKLAAATGEAQQRKKAEREKKKEELQEVVAEVQQWEKDEKEQQARRAAEVAKLRGEREVQLEEQANRRQVAAELRKRGDAELSARVALDVKKQMEAEAAAKAKAKEDLKAFLLSNEINKKIREEQAEAERQQDIVYMQQQAAQLDKQERERQQLLEKVKAVQNRQAEDAKQRPPFKRWVAEEIIEKQFQEKQAALAAEEERRKAAQRAAAARFRADIGGQLAEKEAARLAELRAKREELVALMADLEVCKKTGAEAKAAELARMRAFKADLDAQIEDNQARRHLSSMSDAERKLNAKLLREVEAAAAGGAIRAFRSP
ncbi:hypothetical protein ABPG75_010760 [Micractinium tetrahymenae]